MNYLIIISKEEKDVISKRLPNVHIIRTMKQRSKRHRYYCEESKSVMKILREMRGGNRIFSKKGVAHGHKTQAR